MMLANNPWPELRSSPTDRSFIYFFALSDRQTDSTAFTIFAPRDVAFLDQRSVWKWERLLVDTLTYLQ